MRSLLFNLFLLTVAAMSLPVSQNQPSGKAQDRSKLLDRRKQTLIPRVVFVATHVAF